MKDKFVTTGKLIELLKTYPENTPIVLSDPARGWLNGVQTQLDTQYYYDRNNSNKMYMFFEDYGHDHKQYEKKGVKRKSIKVLKIESCAK